MLTVSDLWARYSSGGWVLRGISLSLKSGEVGLIIGDTGSGKTTLVRALSGVLGLMGGSSRGSIKVGGIEVSGLSPRDRGRLIGVLYQDPAIHFTYPRVDEDLELTAAKHGLSVRDLLKMAGLNLDLRGRLVTELSMGQLQRLAIAKIMAGGARVIVMDEPLAHLDVETVGRLMDVVRVFKESGGSVLMLEHRYEQVLGLVDRVFQLSDGKLIEVDKAQLTRLNNHGLTLSTVNYNANAQGWLRLSDVWFKYDDEYVLRGINLTASSNRVIIMGPNGGGKSTLLRLILGVVKPSRGRVHVDDPRPALYIPQDVNTVASMSDTVGGLYMELAEAASKAINLELLRRELKSLELNINVDDDPMHLSEGQKRLLLLAIARLVKPRLLVMDEPTSGLSARYRVELARFINEANLRVIMATQDLHFAALINNPEAYYLRGWDGYVAEVGISGGNLQVG